MRTCVQITVFCAGMLLLCQALFAGLTFNESQMQMSDTKRAMLQPARDMLQKGNLEECRRLAARAVSEAVDLPHGDIVVSLWLCELGEFAACQQLLEQVSVIEPGRLDLHYAYAEVARKNGRTYDAWTHLNIAESTDPPAAWSKEYTQEFATQVLFSKALVAEQRRDWKASKELFTRLQELGTSGSAIPMGLGRAAFEAGDAAGAESLFRQAATIEPDQIVPELIMAGLYAAQKKYEETELWFKRGAAENKSHGERIRLDHATWLLREQRAPDAMRLAQAAATESKYADEFAFIRALAYYMYEKFSESETELARLAQKKPGDVRINNQLALSLVESTDEGKRARALQVAVANAKLASQSGDILATLAWVQFRLGDLQASQQTAATILGRGGQLSRDSAYFLAQILADFKQTEQAQTLLEIVRNNEGEFFNERRLERQSAQSK